MNDSKGEVIIYKDKTGPNIEVSFQDDTVWLTQQQVAEIFGVKKAAISKHVKNIFDTGELNRKATVSKMETVQNEGGREVRRSMEYYNLDLVLSVGYRVNSTRATQFRIWATQRLREYIVKGYIVNEKRLRETEELRLKELQEAHMIIQKALETKRLDGYEKELVNIISDYTNTWVTLHEYDKDKLSIENVSKKKVRYLEQEEVKRAIERFKKRLLAKGEAGELFGRESSGRFGGILESIKQSFGGAEIYPSIEEKAAHLLYFIIKDHPFVDGNKRIGSLLFILFLIDNNYLYNKKGERKINDNALTALALLVAESHPSQKSTMVRLIVNLINKK